MNESCFAALPQSPRSSAIPSEYQQVSPELDIHKAKPVQSYHNRTDSQDQTGSEYSEPRKFNYPAIPHTGGHDPGKMPHYKQEEQSLSEFDDQSMQNFPLHRGGKSQDLSKDPEYGGAGGALNRPLQNQVRKERNASEQSSPGVFTEPSQQRRGSQYDPVMKELKQSMYLKAQQIPQEQEYWRESVEHSGYSKANNIPHIKTGVNQRRTPVNSPQRVPPQQTYYQDYSQHPQLYQDYTGQQRVPNGTSYHPQRDIMAAFYNKPTHRENPRQPAKQGATHGQYYQQYPQRNPAFEFPYGDHNYEPHRTPITSGEMRREGSKEPLCTAV